MPSDSDMKKIDVYLGMSPFVLSKLQFWLSIGPPEPFHVDEFIEWIEQQQYFI